MGIHVLPKETSNPLLKCHSVPIQSVTQAEKSQCDAHMLALGYEYNVRYIWPYRTAPMKKTYAQHKKEEPTRIMLPI